MVLLFVRNVEVGDGAFDHLRGEVDGFGESWMRVNSETEILRIGTHLDGHGRLGDQIARMWPDNPRTNDPSVSLSNSSLVTPSSRPIPSARPLAAHGKTPFSNSMPCSMAALR